MILQVDLFGIKLILQNKKYKNPSDFLKENNTVLYDIDKDNKIR